MKSRTAGLLVVLLVVLVVAGGVGWWSTRDRATMSGGDAPEATAPASPSPSPTQESEEPAPQGRPVAPCAPTRVPGRLPGRYWGMHATTPIGAEFPDAPVRAVNLTTSQVYWDQVETAPGQYDFSRIDQIVASSEDRDAQPMLVLGFTPSFHAARPESPTARATMPDLSAWRAWVGAVAERYGSRIDYQVWPEPNIVSNWEDSPAQMARLTAVAGEIIHEQAPEALVVAPATTLRLTSQQRWMDRFWATEVDGSPVADSVDAVALDPFPLEEGTPEDSLDLVCRAQEILEKHDVDLPVWTNEINYGVPSGGPSSGVAPYADDRQAAVVARTYLLHAALGVERVYWLGWFSYPGLAVEMSRDGVTTPAGQAFVRVHGWMAGGSVPECSVQAGTHTCVARRNGTTTTVHWRERGGAAVRLPTRAEVQTLAGATRVAGRGERLRLGPSPVAVITRG